MTSLGPCVKVAAAQRAGVREAFLSQQSSAAYYVDFDDFDFYRVEPTALRYVGGFGRMSWVSAEDYGAAEPDPRAAAASGILKHMNVRPRRRGARLPLGARRRQPHPSSS